MIELFRERFRTFLTEYRTEIAKNPLMLSVLEPLYSLADRSVYDDLRISGDMLYHEISNLVALMQKDPERTALVQLAEDLIAEGYDAQTSAEFDPLKTSSELNITEAIAEGKTAALMAAMGGEI